MVILILQPDQMMMTVSLSCLLVFLCLHPQDLEVVTRFLPAMMSVVVDDHTFTVEQKLPSEEKSSLSYPTTLPDAFNR